MEMKRVLIPVDSVAVVVVIGLLEQGQDFGQLSLEWEEWEPLLGLGLEQEMLELGVVQPVPELGRPLPEQGEPELLLGLEQGMVLELGAVQPVPELGQMGRG